MNLDGALVLNTTPPKGVHIQGNVILGRLVDLSPPIEINGTGSLVTIGDQCDIAAGVQINVADSHLYCLGLSDEIDRRPIKIGAHVFIGANAVILGGCDIGHHSVIGAGLVLPKGSVIPPYSLVALGYDKRLDIGESLVDPCVPHHVRLVLKPRYYEKGLA